MIVLVPVNRDRETVCPSFGHAPYFYLVDAGGDGTRIVENPAANDEGGAGIRAARAVVRLRADAVVTPLLGENAAKLLRDAGIGLFRPESDDARTNVGAMLAGALEPLTELHTGLRVEGGS